MRSVILSFVLLGLVLLAGCVTPHEYTFGDSGYRGRYGSYGSGPAAKPAPSGDKPGAAAQLAHDVLKWFVDGVSK